MWGDTSTSRGFKSHPVHFLISPIHSGRLTCIGLLPLGFEEFVGLQAELGSAYWNFLRIYILNYNVNTVHGVNPLTYNANTIKNYNSFINFSQNFP